MIGALQWVALLRQEVMADVQSALDPAADQAQAIHGIWDLMLWICVPMYVLVLLALAFGVWRARRQRRTHRDIATATEEKLYAGLGVWIVIVVLGLTVLTAASFFVDRKLIPVQDAQLDIRITAKQWWWQVEYLNDDPSQQFMTANELHLPLAQKAHIELRSDDVIHSFWVPNLSGKRDMIPGRVNQIELTPRRAGKFRGTCAEFCGLQHAKMSLMVYVDENKNFASWRSAQLAAAPAPSGELLEHGKRYFETTTCAMCHTINGTTAHSLAGPDLTHLASRSTIAAGALPLNAGSLAAWLSDPQRQKPGTNMPTIDIEPDDLNALVAYLLSLK